MLRGSWNFFYYKFAQIVMHSYNAKRITLVRETRRVRKFIFIINIVIVLLIFCRFIAKYNFEYKTTAYHSGICQILRGLWKFLCYKFAQIFMLSYIGKKNYTCARNSLSYRFYFHNKYCNCFTHFLHIYCKVYFEYKTTAHWSGLYRYNVSVHISWFWIIKVFISKMFHKYISNI